MGRIPQATIDQILDRTDILDIVSSYVNLKRRGQNFFGLCPFHKEKTGSFSVNPGRQIFKCFGCGKSGSAIGFIQAVENLTFGEAVRFLADKAGVRIELDDERSQAERVQPEVDRWQVLRQAAALFARWLEESQKATQYLAGRGIDVPTARRFGLGYAPDSWDALLSRLSLSGVSPQVLEELGLVVPRQESQGYYDRFRNRIIFPIANPLGRVVAFGGRILGDGEPKYLNSPETPLFNKARTLYLLDKAREAIRRQGRTLVVEGYMDAIALHRFGYECTVASLGTSLTENQARVLRRYGENIYLIYDGDTAGLEAARRGVEVFLSIGLPVHVVMLPAGEDPDSLLAREGPQVMKEVLEDARDGFRFCLEQAIQAHGLDSTLAKRAVAREVLPILARIPDGVVRADYITLAAGCIGVDEVALRHDLSRLRGRRRPMWPEEKQPSTEVTQLRMENLEPAERDKVYIIAVILNGLGLTRTEHDQPSPGAMQGQPLRDEQRDLVNRSVDLIPDRDGYPLSVVIKRLLSIKPKTYRTLAALLEEVFGNEPILQAIVAEVPDLVPIEGDRDRMLADAVRDLEERRKKLDSQRLIGALIEKAGRHRTTRFEDAREYLRQLDALHGLGKKKSPA